MPIAVPREALCLVRKQNSIKGSDVTMSKLPYVYEFSPDDLQGIKSCHDQHGFAIVKGILTQELVEQLKSEVRRVLEPRFTDESIRSATAGAFIEDSPVFAGMMLYEPVMKIVRHLNDHEPITLNRSAAIYKKPGAQAGAQHSGAMVWHTDWGPLNHPYRANHVLNNTGASSFWFYLTGSRPIDAGLAIIPDSHTEDWPGPPGFEFTEHRGSFYPKGTEPQPYTGMDVPGVLHIVSDPGDLVIFAERTYHGVNPHQGTESRLSCAYSFRRTSYVVEQHWEVPESAKRFIASCPPELQPLVEGYLGLDKSWISSPNR